MVMLLAPATLIFRTAGPVPWHFLTVAAAALTTVPMLQYGLGLIIFSGSAWINTAYLLGFFLAILTGGTWEKSSSGQFADGLFLAIGVASLISVGLQLHQWLSLDLLGIWSMGDGYGRPFANFGQPNNLGTFLLWGLLGLAWGLLRKKIGIWTALPTAAFLLFGLALTQSRTAWIGMALLVGASWFWRSLWPNRRWVWFVTALGLYFAICVAAIGWFNQLLLLALPGDVSDIARIASEQRPAVWAMFLDAVLLHPWFGYGWGQVGFAQIAVALDHAPLNVYFSQSHNLILDLVLWCGIPLGLSVSIALIAWLWRRLVSVTRSEDVVLLLFVLIVANHAMLELPLHHAFFLLPTGLVMGALNVRMNARNSFFLGRWCMTGTWLISVALLGLLIRDYTKIESSYQALRFEWAHIRTKESAKPPNVVLLNQWREFVVMERFEPTRGMSDQDLEWVRNITKSYPSAGFFHKLAGSLAMNHRPEEAKLCVETMCRIVSETQCQAIKAAWTQQSLVLPEFSAVHWRD